MLNQTRIAMAVALCGAVACPAAACSSRPYDYVSDLVEMSSDASRTGDYLLAVSYANRAVEAAAQMRGVRGTCAAEYAEAIRKQMSRREAIIASFGRTPKSLSIANTIAPRFSGSNSCG